MASEETRFTRASLRDKGGPQSLKAAASEEKTNEEVDANEALSAAEIEKNKLAEKNKQLSGILKDFSQSEIDEFLKINEYLKEAHDRIFKEFREKRQQEFEDRLKEEMANASKELEALEVEVLNLQRETKRQDRRIHLQAAELAERNRASEPLDDVSSTSSEEHRRDSIMEKLTSHHSDPPVLDPNPGSFVNDISIEKLRAALRNVETTPITSRELDDFCIAINVTCESAPMDLPDKLAQLLAQHTTSASVSYWNMLSGTIDDFLMRTSCIKMDSFAFLGINLQPANRLSKYDLISFDEVNLLSRTESNQFLPFVYNEPLPSDTKHELQLALDQEVTAYLEDKKRLPPNVLAGLHQYSKMQNFVMRPIRAVLEFMASIDRHGPNANTIAAAHLRTLDMLSLKSVTLKANNVIPTTMSMLGFALGLNMDGYHAGMQMIRNASKHKKSSIFRASADFLRFSFNEQESAQMGMRRFIDERSKLLTAAGPGFPVVNKTLCADLFVSAVENVSFGPGSEATKSKFLRLAGTGAEGSLLTLEQMRSFIDTASQQGYLLHATPLHVHEPIVTSKKKVKNDVKEKDDSPDEPTYAMAARSGGSGGDKVKHPPSQQKSNQQKGSSLKKITESPSDADLEDYVKRALEVYNMIDLNMPEIVRKFFKKIKLRNGLTTYKSRYIPHTEYEPILKQFKIVFNAKARDIYPSQAITGSLWSVVLAQSVVVYVAVCLTCLFLSP
jgi:hypothetical protein